MSAIADMIVVFTGVHILVSTIVLVDKTSRPWWNVCILLPGWLVLTLPHHLVVDLVGMRLLPYHTNHYEVSLSHTLWT